MYTEVLRKGGGDVPQDGYPNLIGAGDRTPEEYRANGVKAGKKSGESRRRLRTFREVAKAILDSPENDPAVLELLQQIGLEGTKRDALTLAQIVKAGKGDTDAFRMVRDTVGEKPREELEIGGMTDRPIQTIDLTQLSDNDLRRLAAARAED